MPLPHNGYYNLSSPPSTYCGLVGSIEVMRTTVTLTDTTRGDTTVYLRRRQRMCRSLNVLCACVPDSHMIHNCTPSASLAAGGHMWMLEACCCVDIWLPMASVGNLRCAEALKLCRQGKVAHDGSYSPMPDRNMSPDEYTCARNRPCELLHIFPIPLTVKGVCITRVTVDEENEMYVTPTYSLRLGNQSPEGFGIIRPTRRNGGAGPRDAHGSRTSQR